MTHEPVIERRRREPNKRQTVTEAQHCRFGLPPWIDIAGQIERDTDVPFLGHMTQRGDSVEMCSRAFMIDRLDRDRKCGRSWNCLTKLGDFRRVNRLTSATTIQT